MKKINYLRAAVIAMFLLFLFQCRTSEESINLQNAETNEKIDAFVRFEQQLKKAKKSKTISEDGDSYAPPFIEIIKQFFENHPDYHADFTQNVGTIDFRVTSQTIGEDEKMVLFPILKENKVNAVLFCRINKDKNFVKFSIVKDKLSEFGFPIDEFQNYYNKISIKKNMISAREVAIPEVVITKLRRSDHPFSEIFIPDWSWTAGGGGSGSKMNGSGGVHNGGGGGRNGNNDNGANADNDPCSKIKSNLADAYYKLKYNELNKTSNFTEKKEKGFYETKDGWFIGLEQSSSTSTSDGLKVPIADDVKGYTHIHLNDYETGKTDDNGAPEIRKPIRMFSPADVNTLMELAKIQTNGSYGDLYGTMLSSEGNYIIKFTGTATSIKTGFDTPTWREDYKKFIVTESGSLEKKFLRFLSEKMGVTDVSLYKINNDGTVEQKTLSSNNKISSTKCP